MLTDALANAVVELDEELVASLVTGRLAEGVRPLDMVKNMQEGMVEVGRRFQDGEYFLSELIMCGEIMSDAMKLLEPHLGGETGATKGTIVIGTVKGDIHDLGKNIVVMLLKGAGYNVVDLGVDVPKEKFVQALQETKAPLVAMSVLLTGCQESMKEAVIAIREAGLDTKVLIGGNYIDEFIKDYVGADYSASIASDAPKIAEAVLGA